MSKLATGGTGRLLFTPLLKQHAAVFMMHRFGDEAGAAHRVADLRKGLELLRRTGTPVITLDELVDRLENNALERSVVLTVDDGYHDFHSLAAPVFREYGFPVTVFLPTGFIDGRYWFWWDKLRYAATHARAESIDLPDGSARISLVSADARALASGRITDWVKRASEPERAPRLQAIFDALAVEVPADPPAEYRPMSWDQVRECTRYGIDFAPHTVNHPSMEGLDAASLRHEVKTSFARLAEEIPNPVRVFCYPYGKASDVSPAVMDAVAAEGMRAAVTAEPGYVGPSASAARYALARFSFDPQTHEFAAVTSGFERFKELVRGVRA